MATFTKPEQLQTFKTYKAALKTALAKLKPGAPTPFVFLDKFAFDDKERVLVLLDYQADLLPQLPKKPTATGKCRVDDAERIVFDTSAKLPHDKLVKLLADAGVPRPVAHPDDKGGTTEEPEATKLDMAYGWTEMRSWGDEAQELIEAFDGLVGVYRGLPEARPEWAELAGRHDAVRQAMAAMIRTRIANDKTERQKKLLEVKALTKEVRHLSTELRAKAEEASRPKPSAGGASSPKPAQQPASKPPEAAATATPASTTTTAAATTAPAKRTIEVSDLTEYVVGRPPRGKETVERYVELAGTKLRESFGGVTDKHLEALEKLARKRYFPDAPKAAESAKPAPKAAAAPVDWEEKVVDLNGRKADLSGFDDTLKTKIVDIPMTGGRNHHGNTVLGGTHGECLHWRSGDLRIFGTLNGDGSFTLIGTGRHSGKGNSNYKIDLLLGGTTTATTG